MTRLHTLRVFGGVGQRKELLLQLCGDIDARKVSALSPDSNLLAGLVAKENALLRDV